MQQRKLGYWESVLCLLHDRLMSTGTVVSMSQLMGRLDLARLQQALCILMQRHPLLRAILNAKEDGYHFELSANPSAIPLTLISRLDDKHWQRVVEQQLLESFEPNKVLWRVILLQSDDPLQLQNEVIFLIHHAIADGLSCVHLNAQCFKYYQHLAAGEDITIEPLPLLDAVERMLDHTKLPPHNSVDVKPVKLSPFFYQQKAPLSERRTKNIYRSIASKELANFLSACRAKSRSVNSVLNAILLLTVAEMERDTLNLSLLTPLNLRPYCQPTVGVEHFGCYITCVTTQHNSVAAENDVWQLAAAYSKQLLQQMAQLDQLATDLSQAALQKQSQLLCCDDAETRTQYPAGFVVSNKGRIDVPMVYGELEWQQYYTTSSRRAGDIVVNLSLTTIQENMFLCFSYTEPLLSADWVERLAERFIARCLALH